MLWQMAGQDVHMMMPLQHCAVACMCCNDWRRTNDDGVGEGVAGHEVGLRCARHAAQHLPLAHRVLAGRDAVRAVPQGDTCAAACTEPDVSNLSTVPLFLPGSLRLMQLHAKQVALATRCAATA